MPLKIRLTVTNGSSAGTRIRVEGESFRIGRHEDSELQLKSSSVSRRHCVIVQHEDRVMIQDLGSRNGTIVNDNVLRKGQACRLWHEDILTIGKRTFRVSVRDLETDRAVRNRGSGSAIANLSGTVLPAVPLPTATSTREASSAEPVEMHATLSTLVGVDAMALLDELDKIAPAGKLPPPAPRDAMSPGPSPATAGGEADSATMEADDSSDETTGADDAQAFEDEDATTIISPADGDSEAREASETTLLPSRKPEPRRLPEHLRPKGPADSQDAAAQALRRMFSGGR